MYKPLFVIAWLVSHPTLRMILREKWLSWFHNFCLLLNECHNIFIFINWFGAQESCFCLNAMEWYFIYSVFSFCFDARKVSGSCFLKMYFGIFLLSIQNGISSCIFFQAPAFGQTTRVIIIHPSMELVQQRQNKAVLKIFHYFVVSADCGMNFHPVLTSW